MTNFLGGEIANKKVDIIPTLKESDYNKLVEKLDELEKDPVQVDIFLKEHGLDKVQGLKDYILNNDIQRGSINELIQAQNYQNIADQAHGFTGVNTAIKEFNKLEDEASKSKFAETISNTNGKLGTYLNNLNGAKAGMGNYIKSLATATLKSFALEAATTALNAAISFGISLIINGAISAIQYLASANERYIESQQKIIDKANENIAKYDEEISSLEDLQKKIKDAGTDTSKLASLQDELSGVIGNSSKILDGNANAVEAANIKIQNRIEALKKLREEELKNKISAQRNKYNNNEVLNDWGSDDKLSGYFSKELSGRYKQYVMYDIDTYESYADYLRNELEYNQTDNLLPEPSKDEIQSYLDKQFEIAKDTYADYISGLETIFSTDELYKILEQAVYMNPDDIDAVYETFNKFIKDFDKDGIQKLYDNYINSLTDDIEGNSDEAYKKLEDSIKKISEKYPFAKMALSNFLDFAGYDSNVEESNRRKIEYNVQEIENKNFKAKNTKEVNDYIDTLIPEDKEVFINFALSNSYENVKEKLQDLGLGNGGNVDLTIRPKIHSALMQASGWDVEDNSYSTVNTSTYSNQDGTVAINFTPIQVDKNGNPVDILSPEGLQKYAEDVIAGVREDDLKLQIGSAFNGENAIKQAEDAAEEIHLWQALFYSKNNDEYINSVNELIDYINNKTIELTPITSILTKKPSDAEKSTKNFIDQFQEDVGKIGDVYQKLLEGDSLSSTNLIDMLQELSELGADFEGMDTLDLSSISSELENLKTEKLDQLIKDLNIDPDSTLAQALHNIADEAINVSSAMEGVTNTLSNIQSGYDSLTNAIKEYNENGYLTIDTLNSILKLSPEYLSALIDENGQIQLNIAGYEALAKAALEESKQIVVNEAMTKLNSLAKNELKTSTDEASAAEQGFIDKLKNSWDTITTTTKKIFGLIAQKIGLKSIESADNANKSNITGIENDYNGDGVYDANDAKSYAESIKQSNQKLTGAVDEVMTDMNAKLALIDATAANAGASLKTGNEKNSKDSSSKDKDPEKFDWIETAINNLNDALDVLKDKADDTYSSWISRNEHLQQAISATQQSIDLQSQAYQRYMAQANSVSLSDSWKNLVQNGAIDISKIADEDLANNIKEYQEWYNKAQDCLKTQNELQDSLNELNSQKFTNIQSEYEALIDLMESQKSLLENQITVLSDKSTYDQLRSQQSQILNSLQNERNALQSTINSLNIQAGTEKWNELNSQIADIDQSIQDAKTALQDINKMQFDNLKEFFELSIDLMDKQKSLAENRISLLSSSADYEGLKKQQSDIISNYEQELARLNEIKNSGVFAGMSYADQMSTLSEIADVTQSLDDAYKTLKEISQLEFDNIKESFEFNISELEHAAKLLDDKISLAETNGLYVDTYYYSQQEQLLKAQQNKIADEIAQLTKVRDASGYEIGTSEWNAMTSEIMSLREEESSMTTELAQINKTLRELDWEIFDYLAESANDIIGESDFLIDLMSYGKLVDKDGKFTEEGEATLALNLVNADIYKQQAENYFAEAKELEEEISRGAGKETIDRFNELTEAGRNALLSQKDAIKEVISLVEERYNAELDALQKVIDAKKKQMEQESELYRYQKSIREKTDNIASLEKQEIAISGDDSEETMARIQRIQLELKEAKEDLQETEYEKYLSDESDMLDQLAEDYSTWMNERLDDQEALLKELATATNNNGDRIVDALTKLAEANGIAISDNMGKLLDKFNILSDRFGEDTQRQFEGDYMTTLEKALMIKTNDEGYKLPDAQDHNKLAHGIKPQSGTEKAVSDKEKQYADAAGLFPENLTLKDAQTIQNKVLGILPNTEEYTKEDAIKALRVALKLTKGYKNGTSHVPKDGIYLTQEDGTEIILSQKEGLLTPLGQGDMVFTAEQSKRLMELVKNPAMNLNIPTPTVPEFVNNSHVTSETNTNIGEINIELPNVENYEDFRNNLIKDRTFEKSMCTMVNNAIMGKSTIEKRKYV